MNSVIIFITSFVLICILFLSKHREVRTGEKNLLGRILTKFDNPSVKILHELHIQIYKFFQNVRFIFLVKLPEKAQVKISETKESVIKEYNKQRDVIMGKKELNGNGSSSFFLRKMNDTKKENEAENGERGRIEDSF